MNTQGLLSDVDKLVTQVGCSTGPQPDSWLAIDGPSTVWLNSGAFSLTARFPLIATVFLSLTESSVSALAVQPSGTSGCWSGWCWRHQISPIFHPSGLGRIDKMSIMECPSQDRPLVTDLQEWLGLGHPPAGAPEPWDKALGSDGAGG